MSDSGRNLPDFKALQLDFAAHIRNPELNPAPGGVEARRMKIYADLFFNNIKSFLDSAFPVAAEVVGVTRWRQLVRDFVHLHPSESPFFLQISEEFLTFLHHQKYADLPGFLLELCHYEWVELSLDVATEPEQPIPLVARDPADPDYLMGRLSVSTLVRALVYQYPVHEIGRSNQPSAPPASPTYLLVYRNSDNEVRFLQSNPVTHRLLELLAEKDAASALQMVHAELSAAGRTISQEKLMDQGRQTLAHLCDLGIIQGEIVSET
jgi:uncharacterized protein